MEECIIWVLWVSFDDFNNSIWLYEQTGSGCCTFELLMMNVKSLCVICSVLLFV